MRSLFLAALFSSLFAGALHGQFYYPDRREYGTPETYGLKYEVVSFHSKDGTLLTGWFVPALSKPLGTVIHFHGNAQNMTSHFSYVSWLPKEGFNVFVFDYRGYGKSQGTPTQQGVYEDSVAAIEYLKSRPDIDQTSIFILGQSLGGTNAIAAVAENHFSGIRAVVVESTFYSYKSIAEDKAAQLSLSGVAVSSSILRSISDAHSAGLLIGRLSPIKLLLIHGTMDPVVPFSHGTKLFEAAKEPKEMWTIPKGGHVEAFSTYGDTYRPKLVEFFLKCLNKA